MGERKRLGPSSVGGSKWVGVGAWRKTSRGTEEGAEGGRIKDRLGLWWGCAPGKAGRSLGPRLDPP